MTDTLRNDIFSFYRQFYPRFWENRLVRNRVLAYNDSTPPYKIYKLPRGRRLFERIFDHYLEEAYHIINLIKPFGLEKNKVILEIGGGLGLVYGYLKKRGYQIFSLEPSLSGYAAWFAAGQALFKIIDVAEDGWKSYPAAEVTKFRRRFDLIFSNNVLEHIDDLNGGLAACLQVLKPKGIMVHNTVNYLLPYDPHYKFALLPFLGKMTQIFRPELKLSPLWQDLNFSNALTIFLQARQNGLTVRFLPGQLSAALDRLDSDPEFGYRHRKMKKYQVILRLLTYLPPFFQTPMAVRFCRRRP